MRRSAALLLCASALVLNGWSQECTAVLGAVRDVSTSTGSKSYYTSFKRFFCEQTFSNAQEAEDAGAELKIPIKNLPVSFEGHDKKSQWSQYQHSVCESLDTFTSFDFTWKDSLSQANSAVVDAWKACVNSYGLHFWAEVNEDKATELTLVAKYVSSGPPFTTLVSDPLTFSGTGVTCPPSSFNPARGSKGAISSAEKRADCSRKDDSVATNITLHTKSGDRTIRLRAALNIDRALPSVRNNVFVPNAMIALDTDHGVFTAQHVAALSIFPIEWTGPSMGHPPLGTSAKALYKVSLLAPPPTSDHLGETLRVQTNVGGQCGAGATGGSGGVNPEWRTTIELPRRRGTESWQVHLTSTSAHKVPNSRCSVAIEGKVIDLKADGQSEAEFPLTFGEHVLEFACSGQNPYTGCYGHAKDPNGVPVNEHYELYSYSWTVDATPAKPAKFGFQLRDSQ